VVCPDEQDLIDLFTKIDIGTEVENHPLCTVGTLIGCVICSKNTGLIMYS